MEHHGIKLEIELSKAKSQTEIAGFINNLQDSGWKMSRSDLLIILSVASKLPKA